MTIVSSIYYSLYSLKVYNIYYPFMPKPMNTMPLTPSGTLLLHYELNSGPIYFSLGPCFFSVRVRTSPFFERFKFSVLLLFTLSPTCHILLLFYYPSHLWMSVKIFNHSSITSHPSYPSFVLALTTNSGICMRLLTLQGENRVRT